MSMNIPGVNPVIDAAMREIGDARAGNHRFRRRATVVNAGSTHVLALYQRRSKARIGEGLTQRIRALA